jgi:hypothetical protein
MGACPRHLTQLELRERYLLLLALNNLEEERWRSETLGASRS